MSQHDPVLWDAKGEALSLEGQLIAPNALNVASVIQLAGKAYSFRWDEAMRDAPINALAMRRDTFYLSLIQERIAPLVNLDWEVQGDDEDDVLLKLEAETLTRAWREVPDRPGLITNLAGGAVWFGRSAQQGIWGKTESGLTNWTFHEPVHGDNVQFSWDNTPIVLVSSFTAEKVRASDPAAVVSSTDRGAFGIRLYKPAYRSRFIIHKHVREAADYFEGEMSGGVHGVGLRSWLYWGDYIRRDVFAAMLSFMNSTGMMDIICFNFPMGDKAAEARAIENAKKVSGKIALVMPRDPNKDFPAIEQFPMNTAGVEVMKNLVAEYCDRHAERLVVGQSMSAGADKDNGLGGTGRAEFAADTKFQLTKTDANRLAETLTTDWLRPCHRFNFPASKYGHRLRMVPILDDPKAETKVKNAGVLISNGVKIEAEELRKAAGFREPRPGKETVGGQQPGQVPGGDPTNPNAPPGGETGRATSPKDDKPEDDFAAFGRFIDRMERLLTYRAAQPPFPGAVFDEQKHRWVKPEDKTPPAETGRATSPEAKPESGGSEVEQTAAAEAKAQAGVLKRFGAAVVEKAKKVAERAFQLAVELSYHAQTMNIAEDIADTPWDMSKIINAKGTGDWLSTNLGVSGGFAANVGAKVLSYGLTKLKQFLAKKRGEQSDTTANQLDDFGSVVSYQEQPQHPTDKAELAAWIAGRLLGAMGVPDDKLPPKESFAEQLKELSSYAAAHSPAGGVDVGGKHYPGGQFIPADVMAKATDAEKAKVEGRDRPKA